MNAQRLMPSEASSRTDADGLGTDRTGGLHEAEQGVEAHRALEVVHANADVGEAR